jgi:hypothetical protein
VKHIAQIQVEFLKEARKWDEMSLEEQKAYLKQHPKSKRKITAKPKQNQDKLEKRKDIGYDEHIKLMKKQHDDDIRNGRVSPDKKFKVPTKDEYNNYLEGSSTFAKDWTTADQKQIKSPQWKKFLDKNIQPKQNLEDKLQQKKQQLKPVDNVQAAKDWLEAHKNDEKHDMTPDEEFLDGLMIGATHMPKNWDGPNEGNWLYESGRGYEFGSKSKLKNMSDEDYLKKMIENNWLDRESFKDDYEEGDDYPEGKFDETFKRAINSDRYKQFLLDERKDFLEDKDYPETEKD